MDGKLLRHGLAGREAEQRREVFGPNKLRERKQYSTVKIFLSQFTSPLIYILVFAVVVTIFLRDYVDTLVISLAVVVNTVLGFYQEQKAQQALVALKRVLTPRALVIREGKREEIEVEKVVPGDICLLSSGNRVPADGWVIRAKDLVVNEAILTGESMAVHKRVSQAVFDKDGMSREEVKGLRENFLEALGQEGQRKQLVFMGTTVASGLGAMVVSGTGNETEVGKIASSLEETEEEKTPLMKRLGRLAKLLAVVIGFLAGVLFVGGVLQGDPVVEMFEMAVAVAVAAIPEGLVVSLTVILALGMQRILKRKALVRRLVAAETLGSVSVICADKTGTLTEGKMRVTKWEFEDEKLGRIVAALVNDLRDPLEVAMWDWVKEQGGDPQAMVDKQPRLDEIPFSPEYKYIAVLNEERLFVSGAPEVVLGMCRVSEREKERLKKRLRELGQMGFRIVGFVARERKKGEKKLTQGKFGAMQWLGLLAFEDPVRPRVAESLRQAQKAGIRVKVITGDYKETAIAVLRKLGVKVTETAVIEGGELAKISEEELRRKVDEVVLFARTTPEQKLKIVKVLQEKGEVVAMTGDGVNDAPALKKADIGIVVGGAADVARETADMVLLDSNFKTIVAAVREGRIIFETIRKVIVYLLSSSFTEVVMIGGALLMGFPLPILPAQILWVNLVEDGLPGLALAFETHEKGVMKERPRKLEAPLLDTEMKVIIFIIGLVTDLVLFGLFLILLNLGLPIKEIRSFVFVGLAVDSLFYVFACRSLQENIWQMNFWENKFLIVSVVIGILMMVGAIYLPWLQWLLGTEPLKMAEWAILLGLGIFNLMMIEAVKWIFIHWQKKSALTAT